MGVGSCPGGKCPMSRWELSRGQFSGDNYLRGQLSRAQLSRKFFVEKKRLPSQLSTLIKDEKNRYVLRHILK